MTRTRSDWCAYTAWTGLGVAVGAAINGQPAWFFTALATSAVFTIAWAETKRAQQMPDPHEPIPYQLSEPQPDSDIWGHIPDDHPWLNDLKATWPRDVGAPE